ncbi:hypothetical protein HU200_062151 [Digitaria exilis]|uniref:PLATZ transcription factor family protein n=1 Tax=Digitaria exilis TaxID=1010633 RepID=A0A835A414_9POAL|nr:hypothetical protein HU200_062151 [Digitaria exilis]
MRGTAVHVDSKYKNPHWEESPHQQLPATRQGKKEATKSPRYLPIPSSFPVPFPTTTISLLAGSERMQKQSMMLRRVASSTPVPEWLEALLTTRFFLGCGAHPASPRNECNMFCLDCTTTTTFCYYCRAHRHASHRVIQVNSSSSSSSPAAQHSSALSVECNANMQIRRSSYHDVVRVSEVEDVLDITAVQTYVINSARVLFLNERPQPRGAGAAAGKAAGSPYNCEICGRALLDPFRFCSLGCKLVDTKRTNGGHAAAASDADGIEAADAGRSKNGEARPLGRRRKGIPHRAPFWS